MLALFINHLDHFVLFHSLVWIQLHCLVQQDDGVAQDLSGNSLPGNAELNWRLGITKFIDTKKGTWTLRADHSYRDDYYSTVYNRAREYIEDVSLDRYISKIYSS